MQMSESDHQCPDSEVRIIVRYPRLRTSESKDTSQPIGLVWLWFRSPHEGLAEIMMPTSEPPHWHGRCYSSVTSIHTPLGSAICILPPAWRARNALRASASLLPPSRI